jgi:hypothetical protein
MDARLPAPLSATRLSAMARRPTGARRIRQHGSGMAGFMLAATPVLMLGLGGVELAHWLQLRQTLSLALMEAARTGATHQGNPLAMAQAFEYSLRMAYPRPETAWRILQERRASLGTPWHISILLPNAAAFLDHADPDLRAPRAHPGQRLIRNDGQGRQHQMRIAQGWPQGRGPQSGLTIHQANTLQLALLWPHRPWLPGLARLIRNLAPLASDPQRARLMAAGYLPFPRQVTVAMHTHPALWPSLADGRVTYGPGGPWQGAPDSAIPDYGRQDDQLHQPGSPADAPDMRVPDPASPDGPTGPGDSTRPDVSSTPDESASPATGPEEGPACEPVP